jgi:hypothetical protein
MGEIDKRMTGLPESIIDNFLYRILVSPALCFVGWGTPRSVLSLGHYCDIVWSLLRPFLNSKQLEVSWAYGTVRENPPPLSPESDYLRLRAEFILQKVLKRASSGNEINFQQCPS